MPTPRQLTSTASRTWRRGCCASSASGAASSKPMNARVLKTEAAIIPENPRYFGLLANWVLNTDRVLWLPALAISVMASARITRISKAPSSMPARVEARIPR